MYKRQPSFCTACYRAGRTGDRFMKLLKSGQIHNCCHPNALLTLKEFLLDYASPETRALGEKMIDVYKRQAHGSGAGHAGGWERGHGFGAQRRVDGAV